MAAPSQFKFNDSGAPFRREHGVLKGTYTAATDESEVAASATTNHAAATQALLINGVWTIKLGFVPSYVKVINVTDRITQEWFAGMNAGDYLETAANGDKTLETDDKLVVSATTVTPSPTSAVVYTGTGDVTITVDSGIVTDNDTVVWVAEG